MTVIQAFILGIIQGLTEFLPISSSGHLVVFQRLFDLKEGMPTFDIAVHLATLIAVVAVLWRDVLEVVKKPLGKYALLIVAGTIPTLIIAATFHDTFKSLLESGRGLGLGFLLTGVALWYAEGLKNRGKRLQETTYLDAAIVGFFQGIAILPAVSRSGLTLAGSLGRGLKRDFAIKFSFMLSIPTILAAAGKESYDVIKAGEGLAVEALPLIVGMLAAAVSGYFAVRFMLKLFTKTSLRVFSYYVIALGTLVLIDQLFIGHFFEKLF